MKDIKEQYKQETKERVYSEELESTSYTDEYVRWLEQKLANNTEIIGSVSESEIIAEAKKNYLSKLNDKQPKGGMSVGRKVMLSEIEIVDVIIKTVTHFR